MDLMIRTITLVLLAVGTSSAASFVQITRYKQNTQCAVESTGWMGSYVTLWADVCQQMYNETSLSTSFERYTCVGTRATRTRYSDPECTIVAPDNEDFSSSGECRTLNDDESYSLRCESSSSSLTWNTQFKMDNQSITWYRQPSADGCHDSGLTSFQLTCHSNCMASLTEFATDQCTGQPFSSRELSLPKTMSLWGGELITFCSGGGEDCQPLQSPSTPPPPTKVCDGDGRDFNFLRWDEYVVQDWGARTCSTGTAITTMEKCEKAATMYATACSAHFGTGVTQESSGTVGCQLHRSGIAGGFQFNSNLQGSGVQDHAPVCQISAWEGGCISDPSWRDDAGNNCGAPEITPSWCRNYGHERFPGFGCEASGEGCLSADEACCACQATSCTDATPRELLHEWGKPTTCAAAAPLCGHTVYGESVTKMCPLTCGKPGCFGNAPAPPAEDEISYTKEFLSGQCTDATDDELLHEWGKRTSCKEIHQFCGHEIHGEEVTRMCPATCGECSDADDSDGHMGISVAVGIIGGLSVILIGVAIVVLYRRSKQVTSTHGAYVTLSEPPSDIELVSS